MIANLFKNYKYKDKKHWVNTNSYKLDFVFGLFPVIRIKQINRNNSEYIEHRWVILTRFNCKEPYGYYDNPTEIKEIRVWLPN